MITHPKVKRICWIRIESNILIVETVLLRNANAQTIDRTKILYHLVDSHIWAVPEGSHITNTTTIRVCIIKRIAMDRNGNTKTMMSSIYSTACMHRIAFFLCSNSAKTLCLWIYFSPHRLHHHQHCLFLLLPLWTTADCLSCPFRQTRKSIKFFTSALLLSSLFIKSIRNRFTIGVG